MKPHFLMIFFFVWWIILHILICVIWHCRGGGIILDIAGNVYKDLALFQPLINGIGGNLVSVQASRIATQLHAECERKILPNNGRICQAPWSVFTKGTWKISYLVTNILGPSPIINPFNNLIDAGAIMMT